MYVVPRDEYDRLKKEEPKTTHPVEHIAGDVHGSQVNNIEVTNGGTILIQGEEGIPQSSSSSSSHSKRKMKRDGKQDLFGVVDYNPKSGRARAAKRRGGKRDDESRIELDSYEHGAEKTDQPRGIQWSRELDTPTHKQNRNPRSKTVSESERNTSSHANILRNQQERMKKHIADRVERLHGIKTPSSPILRKDAGTPMDISDDELETNSPVDDDVVMDDDVVSTAKKSMRSTSKRARTVSSSDDAKRGRTSSAKDFPTSPREVEKARVGDSSVTGKKPSLVSDTKRRAHVKSIAYGKRNRDDDETSYPLWKKHDHRLIDSSRSILYPPAIAAKKRAREGEELVSISKRRDVRSTPTEPVYRSASAAGKKRLLRDRNLTQSEVDGDNATPFKRRSVRGKKRMREDEVDGDDIAFSKRRDTRPTPTEPIYRSASDAGKKRLVRGKKRMREEEYLTRDELEGESEIPFKRRGTSTVSRLRRPPSPPITFVGKKRMHELTKGEVETESGIPFKKRNTNVVSRKRKRVGGQTRLEMEEESEIPFKSRAVTFKDEAVGLPDDDYPMW